MRLTPLSIVAIVLLVVWLLAPWDTLRDELRAIRLALGPVDRLVLAGIVLTGLVALWHRRPPSSPSRSNP